MELLEKLYSQVEISQNDNGGILIEDTRTKDPNINFGKLYVRFKFTSKEDYLEWRETYRQILDNLYPSVELDYTFRRKWMDTAPFNLKCYYYLGTLYLLYKIREASKVHADNCYRQNMKQLT